MCLLGDRESGSKSEKKELLKEGLSTTKNHPFKCLSRLKCGAKTLYMMAPWRKLCNSGPAKL
ncbi:unnamed protein product [Ilex paraguariensis]|uniref:Uncharacterized protein n=1 Tax=Ilex paraguariensis TaxID=185542 RepID=A0ABC8RUN1_9AQUA